MQVSSWWMFLSFYQNVLAVPLAIVVFVLLIRAKTVRHRALYGALIVVLFLPPVQRYAGNYYFDYLCRTQAGEFIYRTVDNVEGILQMRPRDGSKDYFDRMRAGDIPEDPWGHTNVEAQHPDWLFVNKSTKYSYLEVVPNGRQDTVTRYFNYDHRSNKPMLVARDVERKSSYGFRWMETDDVTGVLFGIYGGRIEVLDLDSGSSLATKRGFVRVRPWRICPNDKTEEFAYSFVSKVLRPSSVTLEKTEGHQ